jgi:hypothetical protein
LNRADCFQLLAHSRLAVTSAGQRTRGRGKPRNRYPLAHPILHFSAWPGSVETDHSPITAEAAGALQNISATAPAERSVRTDGGLHVHCQADVKLFAEAQLTLAPQSMPWKCFVDDPDRLAMDEPRYGSSEIGAQLRYVSELLRLSRSKPSAGQPGVIQGSTCLSNDPKDNDKRMTIEHDLCARSRARFVLWPYLPVKLSLPFIDT